MIKRGCALTATADQTVGPAAPPPRPLLTHYQYHSSGRLKAPSTHPADSGGRSGRRPIRGGTQRGPIAALLVPLRFRHPQPSRSAARLFGLSLILFFLAVGSWSV